MKRPLAQINYQAPGHLDPREDLSAEQLSLIGAITLSYNQIEYMFRGMANVTLKLHPSLYQHVATRINGFDGLHEIIKHAAKLDNRLSGDLYLDLCDTLSAAKSCKTYRDAIIHAQVQGGTEFGMVVQRRGRLDEVLLTKTALEALLERSIATSAELVTLLVACIEVDGVDLEKFTAEDRQRLEQDFPTRVAQYRMCLKSRRSLPPLPTFPSEPPTRPETEENRALLESD